MYFHRFIFLIKAKIEKNRDMVNNNGKFFFE